MNEIVANYNFDVINFHLMVNKENDAAMNLYLSAGFQKV